MRVLDDLISVIVPIYNVECYLNKCIDSILSQTYRNIEIILVDDGATDCCPMICDEYAKKDARIHVIHQKNRGLSVARNSGIDVATGEYLIFIDSDDYIDKEMLNVLYRNIKKADAEIAVCNFIEVHNNESLEQEVIQGKKFIFDKLEAMNNLYNNMALQTVVAWNKLYKKELFQTLRYLPGKVHEDEYLIHHILNCVNLIVYDDTPLYYYRQRKDSITGKNYNLKRLDVIEAYEDRIEFFQKKGYKGLMIKAQEKYLDLLIEQYYLVQEYYPQERKIYSNIRYKFKKYYLNNAIKISFKNCLKYKLFYIIPLLYKKMKRIWKLKK